MKLLSVRHVLPSRALSNEGILEWIFEENPHFDPRTQQRVMNELEVFWERCGTKTRFMRDRGESALACVTAAARAAIDDAGLDPDALDFVIYCGIGRGWLEPSTASVILGELGLPSATGFDVLDACTGWIRALQIAQGLLHSGTYRAGLIVSGEFNMLEYHGLAVREPEEIIERAAALTVGEAATATVVTAAADAAPFDFRMRSFGEYYDLSMIPLPGANSWARERFRFRGERYQNLNFYTDASRQTALAVRRLVETIREAPAYDVGSHDLVFGHAVSEKACDLVCDALSIPRTLLYRTHAGYGNTASSSVPLAMSLAMAERSVARGDRCFVGVAGAGISVGVCSFLL